MAYSEDHIALAAEYALGTLDADERAQVETMMAVDTEFTAIVHAWEYRLGVLNQMVGSVEPRPIVWENIKAAIGHSTGQQAPLVLPEAPPPPSPPPEPPAEPVVRPRRRQPLKRRRLPRRRPPWTIPTSSSWRAAPIAGAISPPSPPRLPQPWSGCWRCRSIGRNCCRRAAAEAAHPDGRGQDAGAIACALGAIRRPAAA